MSCCKRVSEWVIETDTNVSSSGQLTLRSACRRRRRCRHCCCHAPCFACPSAKLSREGSSGDEQRHVAQDMARVVESAIQSLEQQQRAEQQQQQPTAPAEPSTASAESESKAAESTIVRTAAGHPLSESALHDALGIPPPRELQPHARDPVSAGKQIPSTFQSVIMISSRASTRSLSALSANPSMAGCSACSCG